MEAESLFPMLYLDGAFGGMWAGLRREVSDLGVWRGVAGTDGTSRVLDPTVRALVATLDGGWDDLRSVWVNTGPGSFTGTRVTLAYAHGLGRGRPGLRVHGLRGLEVLVHHGPWAAARMVLRSTADVGYFADRNGIRCSRETLRSGDVRVGPWRERQGESAEHDLREVSFEEAAMCVGRAVPVREGLYSPQGRPQPTYFREPTAEEKRRRAKDDVG